MTENHENARNFNFSEISHRENARIMELDQNLENMTTNTNVI